ncbi:MAG: creatininase family protein [Spirochaetales bacterium]|nr:creatininase family protein [Spirochaetales bacterium]
MKSILDLSWNDIDSLPKDKTLLFMTVAPIEEHGTHLPIGVDIQLGEYWQQKAIKELETEYPDYHFLSIPFLPLAAGCMKGFPGCMYIKPKLLRKIMFEIFKNIQTWGIKYLLIIASHGDPFHNMAIEKACDQINKLFAINFISPMGAFFSYKELNIDLQLGTEAEEILQKYPEDFHAGWIETSMILDISPEKVSENYINAENVVVSEKEMINPRKYMEKTKGKGHLGYPKYSKAQLGQKLNESTKTYIVNVAKKIIEKTNTKKYQHHFLFKIPFLRWFI